MASAAESRTVPHTLAPLLPAVRVPADGRVLAACAIAAVLTDLALRSGVAGVAGALLVVAVTAALLWSGRLENPHARALVASAPLFGVWLCLRAAPWLLALDVVAAAGLLALGAAMARGGRLADLSIPGLAVRALTMVGHGVAGPAFAFRPAASVARGRRWGAAGAVLRGLLLAVPLLLVLGLLLASADAVFASLFRLRLDPVSLTLHAVGLGLGGWAMAGLLRGASADPPAVPSGRIRPLGAVEASVVLGGMVALFSVFAASQAIALMGAGERVLQTAGLTYAEYARSGFFQLLWVAALTLGALLALRAGADLTAARAYRRFVWLALAAVALTLVIVAVAVRRMDVYESVFGSTVLRLAVRASALWIGGVFVLLGLWLAGVGAPRRWFVSAALASGLVALLALNVIDPEAVVARRNVAHAERTGRFDPAYAASLSDDAVPALLDGLSRLRKEAPGLRAALCARPAPRFEGWAAWNRSVEAARAELARDCPAASSIPRSLPAAPFG